MGAGPARLGGGTGWATAVLAEGLLVPAGDGYRFAHEELADWIQGTHLDLHEALRALVHHRGAPHHPHTLPVPHHRIGPVAEALLLLARQHGVPQLALTLEELVTALDADPCSWWAARLLTEVLTRVPDATPYTDVLRLLADGIAERGGEEPRGRGEFGPAFWTALRLPEATRLDLLRRLVLADGPPHEPGPRHLDTVARLLAADPTTVQPLLVRWFDDERPLPATPTPPSPRPPRRCCTPIATAAWTPSPRRSPTAPTAGPTNCSPSWPRRSPPPSAGPWNAGHATSGRPGGRPR